MFSRTCLQKVIKIGCFVVDLFKYKSVQYCFYTQVVVRTVQQVRVFGSKQRNESPCVRGWARLMKYAAEQTYQREHESIDGQSELMI